MLPTACRSRPAIALAGWRWQEGALTLQPGSGLLPHSAELPRALGWARRHALVSRPGPGPSPLPAAPRSALSRWRPGRGPGSVTRRHAGRHPPCSHRAPLAWQTHPVSPLGQGEGSAGSSPGTGTAARTALPLPRGQCGSEKRSLVPRSWAGTQPSPSPGLCLGAAQQGEWVGPTWGLWPSGSVKTPQRMEWLTRKLTRATRITEQPAVWLSG